MGRVLSEPRETMQGSFYNEGFATGPGLTGPAFFRSWSPPTRRASVLYIHGVGGNSADCRRLAERLVGIGCGTIAVDMPGNGHSPPDARPRNERMLGQMRFLRSLLPDPRRERAVLVCDSGGALLGFPLLHSLRREPWAAAVPIVLAEPVFGHDSSTHAYIESCLTFYSRSYASLDTAVAAWQTTALSQVAFDTDADRREFVAGLLAPFGAALVPKGDVARHRELLRTKDFELLTGKQPIPNPTLVLWTEGGRLIGKYDAEVRRVFPATQVHMARGAGHPLPIVREAELSAVQRFLVDSLGLGRNS
jgi:pimeloyl-ACP methyl ester carboxylesterase